MKTLKELWIANGEKPGLKVRLVEWEGASWFCVQGISPKGEFYGFDDEGDAMTQGDYYDGNKEVWDFYTEPEELDTYYQMAVLSGGQWLVRNWLSTKEEFEKEISSPVGAKRFEQTKVILLEDRPIKLPRRKGSAG
jgi:hypothetical protein